MASATRTYDVSICCASQDLAAARACARTLTSHGLRVRLDPSDPHARRHGVARTCAAFIGHAGAAALCDGVPLHAGGMPDALAMAFVSHDVRRADVQRLTRIVPSRVVGVRTLLDADSSGHIVERLRSASRAGETLVEPRFTLAPRQLRRATLASYDRIAPQFGDQWFSHPPVHELEEFLRRLAPRSRVLDAGCGPAHHTQVLAAAGHDVVGIDVSRGMLAQAHRRTHGLRLARMDMADLRFVPATFDAIWCAAAILHVPRECTTSVLTGFRRVLRPNGLLGLNFQVGRASELVQRGDDHRFFEYYADDREMTSRLRAVGFDVEHRCHATTRRNTHDLDVTLEWVTLYARRGLRRQGADARLASEDRQAQVEFGFTPRQEVHVFDGR